MYMGKSLPRLSFKSTPFSVTRQGLSQAQSQKTFLKPVKKQRIKPNNESKSKLLHYANHLYASKNTLFAETKTFTWNSQELQSRSKSRTVSKTMNHLIEQIIIKFKKESRTQVKNYEPKSKPRNSQRNLISSHEPVKKTRTKKNNNNVNN